MSDTTGTDGTNSDSDDQHQWLKVDPGTAEGIRLAEQVRSIFTAAIPELDAVAEDSLGWDGALAQGPKVIAVYAALFTPHEDHPTTVAASIGVREILDPLPPELTTTEALIGVALSIAHGRLTHGTLPEHFDSLGLGLLAEYGPCTAEHDCAVTGDTREILVVDRLSNVYRHIRHRDNGNTTFNVFKVDPDRDTIVRLVKMAEAAADPAVEPDRAHGWQWSALNALSLSLAAAAYYLHHSGLTELIEIISALAPDLREKHDEAMALLERMYAATGGMPGPFSAN